MSWLAVEARNLVTRTSHFFDFFTTMEIRLKALDNKEVKVKEGETVFGREDIPNNDKRCSKKQLVLTRKSNSLYATRKGKNPSRLLRGDEDIILGLLN